MLLGNEEGILSQSKEPSGIHLNNSLDGGNLEVIQQKKKKKDFFFLLWLLAIRLSKIL